MASDIVERWKASA